MFSQNHSNLLTSSKPASSLKTTYQTRSKWPLSWTCISDCRTFSWVRGSITSLRLTSTSWRMARKYIWLSTVNRLRTKRLYGSSLCFRPTKTFYKTTSYKPCLKPKSSNSTSSSPKESSTLSYPCSKSTNPLQLVKTKAWNKTIVTSRS